MSKRDALTLLAGEVVDDDMAVTLAELCRACTLSADQVVELVEQGLIEPSGGELAAWRFPGGSVWRVRCAQRLQRDLGVNIAGAALALELLDELQQLRARLRRLG